MSKMLRVDFPKLGAFKSIVHVMKGVGQYMELRFDGKGMTAQTKCQGRISFMTAFMPNDEKTLQVRLGEKSPSYSFTIDLILMEKVLKMGLPDDYLVIFAESPDADAIRFHISSTQRIRDSEYEMKLLDSSHVIHDTEMSNITVEFKTSSKFFNRRNHLIAALAYADTCAFKTIDGKKRGERGLQLRFEARLGTLLEACSVQYYPPDVNVVTDNSISLGEAERETYYSLLKLKNLEAVAAITSSATVSFGPEQSLCLTFAFGSRGPQLDEEEEIRWGDENAGFIRYIVAASLDKKKS